MREKEVEKRIREVAKALYQMNLVVLVFCGLMFIASAWMGVNNALKYGAFYEQTTIVNGLQRVSKMNVFVNLGMSMFFLFGLITSLISSLFLFSLHSATEESIEGLTN